MATVIVLLIVVVVLLWAIVFVVGTEHFERSNRRARIDQEARMAEWKIDQVSRAAAMAMMEEARKHLPER